MNVKEGSFFFSNQENGYRPFLLTYAISAGCHLIVFAVFILAPMMIPERKWSPSVVNVSLISIPLPGERGTPGPPVKKEEIPEIKKKEATKAIPEQVKKEPLIKTEKSEEMIPLTPKNPVKLSLKKKTYQASKAIESAIKEIEKKADENKPNELTKALDNIRQKVDNTNRNQGTGTGGGGEGGGRPPEQMDFYKVEIAYQIQKNWAFSEQLAGGRKDLSARLVIKILQNGNIQEVFFETKSGNEYFDDSAYKAIQKSNPLPPLPPGYLRPFYMVGLHFTPSGLN